MSKQEHTYSEIEAAFKRTGFTVHKQPTVGKSSPDYFVVSPTGTSSVIEVKTWKSTPSSIKLATTLADSYKSQSGADRAYVVKPGLSRSRPDAGVLSPKSLASILPSLSTIRTHPRRGKKPAALLRPRKYIFAALPFSESFEVVFDTALRPAALQAGVDLRRVDRQSFTGDNVARISKQVRWSAGVIARPVTLNGSVGAIHESPLLPSDAQSPLHPPEAQSPPRLPGTQSPLRPQADIRTRRRMLLSRIVGRFKMTTAKSINLARGGPGTPVWQRNYFEYVIRRAESLNRTRAYTFANPARWTTDRYDPQAGARTR